MVEHKTVLKPDIQLVASAGDREQAFLHVASARDLSAWPAWLQTRALQGKSRFEALGLPHRRIEEWKYTDLRAQLGAGFTLPGDGADTKPAGPCHLGGDDAIKIIFVNGRYQGGSSALPKGVTVLTFKDLSDDVPEWLLSAFGPRDDDEAMAALNAALLTDGVFIHVAKDAALDQPLLLHSHTDTDALQHHLRVGIVLEEDARATFLEEHTGEGAAAYFSNMVVNVHVGAGAHFHHYKLQSESRKAFHLATVFAQIGAGATLESFYLSGGAGLSRNDIVVRFSGEGAHASVSGAYLATGTQHCDTTSLIDHAVPKCTSREVFRGVLSDESRGVFQGKIIVQEDAQHTDGYQMSKALLLTSGAEIDAKPELEIYADDVKCSHGATSGELDEDSIFYLRSRGLSLDAAKALLVEAFLDDAVDEISLESVKAPMKSAVADWLRFGAEGQS